MATATTTITIVSKGPTRFDQRGDTLRRAGHHRQTRNMVGSFRSQVLPIPASRHTSSGLSMCMAHPPTEETANLRLGCCRKCPEVGCGWNWWRSWLPKKCLDGLVLGSLGCLGGVDAHKSGQDVHRHRKWVQTWGAPNVTHSAVWGAWAP